MDTQIYYNGDILTMEGREAEAVCVCGGRIEKVGSLRSVLGDRPPGAELVDLGGRTLLPGFIDSHSHITAYAQTLRLVPLAGAGSFEEIVSRLRAFKEKNGLDDAVWLIGFGYDHNALKEGRHPDRHLLDAFSNPVLISHASGHMGAANSAALDRVKIGKQTPDPEGGKIGREPDGAPSGYLEEKAFLSLNLPGPDEAESAALLERAQKIYAGYGITTAQEGLLNANYARLLDRMAEENRLLLDIVGYADLSRDRDLPRAYPRECGRYFNRFRIGGYKIFLDGSPQGRTAWLSRPYLPEEEGYCGYPVHRYAKVERFVRQAREDGMQLLAHCNGDAAAGEFIRAYEQEGDYTLRPVMIHAQLVREDQLGRMENIGMIPSFFIAHTWYWGDAHLKNLGAQRAFCISPAKTALELGLPFTLHQDSPVIEPNMLETVWCAVNRLSREGVVIGEAQRISPYEALKSITLNAAYQYFEEDSKGSIREGKRADLVILDRNPLKTDPSRLREIQIEQTIKDGRTIFKRSGTAAADFAE